MPGYHAGAWAGSGQPNPAPRSHFARFAVAGGGDGTLSDLDEIDRDTRQWRCARKCREATARVLVYGHFPDVRPRRYRVRVAAPCARRPGARIQARAAVAPGIASSSTTRLRSAAVIGLALSIVLFHHSATLSLLNEGGRMRPLTLFAIASVLVGVGCAPHQPPPTTLWAKPGATYDEYLKDRYACIQDARTPVSSGFISEGTGSMSSGQIISRDIAFACMSAHGYTQSPNGFGPPPGGTVYPR